MNISFEPLSMKYQDDVMDIFNYYVEHSFAAYPTERLPTGFYSRFMEMTTGYPAYVIKWDGHLAGFCFLRAWNGFSSFSETAEITYFLHPDYAGKGIGTAALEKLESEARTMGITTLLAGISSENQGSIHFHQKHHFKECGRFPQVGKKFGKRFDVVYMVRNIDLV